MVAIATVYYHVRHIIYVCITCVSCVSYYYDSFDKYDNTRPPISPRRCDRQTYVIDREWWGCEIIEVIPTLLLLLSIILRSTIILCININTYTRSMILYY